ncbi:MAG: hypothetical protein E6I75_10345, partial [Chloroflexi bacterium]
MTIDSKYGVPTVAIHTNVFERVVRSVARVNGMPRARAVFVPQPVMGKSAQELRAYVDGNDPVTGRPVMQEVIEGLTRPFDAQDLEKVVYERTTPRMVDAGTEDELQQVFLENNWTDKLPIVLPTEQRVAEMLAHTSHKPDEVVGHMRPTQFREYWEYTVEKVAVNAVMAGARPEYFPVILAIAASGVSGRGSTTSSAAAMAVVNGPVRHELNMNCGTGALGPYNHANATIGRAYGLLSQNLQGGSEPGLTYMGSQGNNYAYNCITFAENEASDSAVSVFGGCRHTAFSLGLREAHWQDHVRNMLRGMDPREHPTFVLDPITARQFIDRGGFDTKDKLIDWICNNACMPAGEYWDYQLIQNYVYPRATYGEEPYASMLKAAPDEMIRMFQRDEIEVVVVGGETNGYW